MVESRSAKEPGRPIFNSLVQRLYRGDVAGVVCWKLDRLARNPVDGGSIIWAIKQHGIKVVTPIQTFSREDDNTILMYIEFGMAQKYVDDLSRVTRRGLTTKAENGWHPGVAPLGYVNFVHPITKEKSLVKDPERFALVRRMWDLMLTRLYPPTQILKIANNEWGFRTRPTRKMGGRPLSRSGLYQLFTKPFYYGVFEYPVASGKLYHGKHEPMVTEAEFEQVQKLLGRTDNLRPKTRRSFPFTGLIRCGTCNAMVTAEEKLQIICGSCRHKFASRGRDTCPKCGTLVKKMKRAVFLEYTYYHCAKRRPLCVERSISGQELERQIHSWLARIELSQKFKQLALEFLPELHAEQSSMVVDVRKSQERALEDCLRRIDSLVKLKTRPDNSYGALLSDDEYARQRSELLKEKIWLENAIRNEGQDEDGPLERSRWAFEFATDVQKRFKESTANEKKLILATIGSNLILTGKKLSIEAKKPFRLFEKPSAGEVAETHPIEPRNGGLTKSPFTRLHSQIPCVLRDVDDVRTYTRRWRKVVARVYSCLKQRPSCSCEECQQPLLIDDANVLRRIPRRRWNAVPGRKHSCERNEEDRGKVNSG